MQDLDKFNDFFIDKEEDFIIRIQALDDSLEKETGHDVKRLGQLRKAYADLHGVPSFPKHNAESRSGFSTLLKYSIFNTLTLNPL